jgi:predicted DCC family thiol-disulfide oxidoreductase YuxK
MEAPATQRDQDLVLWDGDCGFCRRGVRWFAERDEEERLRMVPYQEAPSPPMTPELAADCARALYVIRPDGTRLRAGRAILHMVDVIGHHRIAGVLAWPPFVWLVEVAYWIVARNRHVFSRFLFTSEREGAATRGE